MGNTSSQFENEFYKRYSYIQHLDDKLFGTVRVYRKNTIKYDYIMILEIPLDHLEEEKIDSLEERFRRVRGLQNQTTLRIYYFRLVNQNKLECHERRIIIYAEYMNRTLQDYLCALRSSPNFVLEVSEIIYVLKNVAKSCLCLKKMEITSLDLRSSKIFLSTDGEVLLCPLLYVLESLKATTYEKEVEGLKAKYQKYSISQLHQSPSSINHSLKQQFINLFLEMSGNLPPQRLSQTNYIFQIIQLSSSLESLYSQLPETEVETVQIEQMHRYDSMTGEFYSPE